MIKNVFVSGSFDLLHSGHIAFLKTASEYGRVYVGIGSDKSIEALKHRPTINKERERLFMVQSIKYVEDAWINKGMGNLDFMAGFEEGLFDIFIVNKDQDMIEKRKFCQQKGIEYIVLERKPEPGLPERSSTKQREYYDRWLP
ncbi:MAG: adenylyltransferase/cytidyltransferase family protein [Bacteroidales bacterium]